MAFKRSAVRSRYAPPHRTNPNLVPLGDGFGFIFVLRKPLARRVVQKKASADDENKKTPFVVK